MIGTPSVAISTKFGCDCFKITVGNMRVLTNREPMKVDSMTSPCEVSTDQF
jgi:hypothetical protein